MPLDTTVTITREGFHGRQSITVQGRDWRAHNETTVSCISPYPSGFECPSAGHCVCGGLPGLWLDGDDRLLIPATWVQEQPALQEVVAQCEAWLTQAMSAAAIALGRRGGQAKSAAKTAAARANARKPRPRPKP